MAKPPKFSQREQLISTFRKRKNPRARTSGRPNTTPANLAKKPGLPAPRQFSASSTFKRSNYPEDDPRWVNTSVIPGYGQFKKRQQRSKIAAGTRPQFGDREGAPDDPRRTYRPGRRTKRRGHFDITKRYN